MVGQSTNKASDKVSPLRAWTEWPEEDEPKGLGAHHPPRRGQWVLKEGIQKKWTQKEKRDKAHLNLGTASSNGLGITVHPTREHDKEQQAFEGKNFEGTHNDIHKAARDGHQQDPAQALTQSDRVIPETSWRPDTYWGGCLLPPIPDPWTQKQEDSSMGWWAREKLSGRPSFQNQRFQISYDILTSESQESGP